MSLEHSADGQAPLVIVGSGLAGYTVAREVRKLDARRRIVMMTHNDGAAYSKPMLSNALALKKNAADLVNSDAAAMSAQLDVSILANRVVGHIHAADREVESLGERLPYSQLVLALGADPRRPPLAGAAADDVLCVNDLRDYARFREALSGCRSVAILGAGLIGVEFANDLAAAGYTVSLLDPALAPLSRLLPRQAGDAFARGLGRQGIRLLLGSVATQIEYAGLAYRLHLADGTWIEADLVVSAIGLAPRTGLARAAGIAVAQGICTDSYCRTSAPEVFALGDCAEIEGKVQPYVLPIMHAARALAATLCGKPTPVRFPVMPVSVKTPAMPAVVAPAPAGADHWSIEVWPDEKGEAVQALCSERESGRVLGFSLLGKAVAAKGELVRRMETPPPT